MGTGVESSPAVESIRARLSDLEFEQIYQRHYRDVYRYSLALTRSHDEAEDVTADTFERAYRAWTRHPLAAGRELPWLLLVARRLSTDRWRRLRRLAALLPGLERSDAGDATDTIRSEFWTWFDALSEALPARQREVLVLRYQRDLEDADIALIMGLSESGVRSLVARALANLRDHPELLA